MGGPRIDPKDRRAIIRAIKAGERRSAIARKFNVSQAAVARIGQAAGIVRRPLTEGQKKSQRLATEAVKIMARRRRAELSLALIEDAERLRRQMWEPSVAFDFGGKDFAFVEHDIPEPEPRSKQALAIAMAICLDKSMALEKFADESSSAARAAIISLIDTLAREEESMPALHLVDS